MMPDECAPICTDTRELVEGAWFVALPGEQFDGHDFLGDAFASGALGCIVAERGSYPIASTSFPLIAVDDTVEALERLAKNWRRRMNPRVIAITGRRDRPISAVTLVLSQVFSSFATDSFRFLPPSGVVSVGDCLKSLLSIEESTRFLLAELTPNSLEELSVTSRALQPNIAVITADGFGNLLEGPEDVDLIQAHSELLANLDPRLRFAFVEDPPGKALNDFLSYYPGKVEIFSEGMIEEKRLNDGTCIVMIPGASREFIYHQSFDVNGQDVWCIYSAAKELGVSDDLIAQGLLAAYSIPLNGRA